MLTESPSPGKPREVVELGREATRNRLKVPTDTTERTTRGVGCGPHRPHRGRQAGEGGAAPPSLRPYPGEVGCEPSEAKTPPVQRPCGVFGAGTFEPVREGVPTEKFGVRVRTPERDRLDRPSWGGELGPAGRRAHRVALPPASPRTGTTRAGGHKGPLEVPTDTPESDPRVVGRRTLRGTGAPVPGEVARDRPRKGVGAPLTGRPTRGKSGASTMRLMVRSAMSVWCGWCRHLRIYI